MKEDSSLEVGSKSQSKRAKKRQEKLAIKLFAAGEDKENRFIEFNNEEE